MEEDPKVQKLDEAGMDRLIQEGEQKKAAEDVRLSMVNLETSIDRIHNKIAALKAAGVDSVSVVITMNANVDYTSFDVGPSDNRFSGEIPIGLGKKGIEARLDEVRYAQEYAKKNGMTTPPKEPKPEKPSKKEPE
jgi:hypothetical protein